MQKLRRRSVTVQLSVPLFFSLHRYMQYSPSTSEIRNLKLLTIFGDCTCRSVSYLFGYPEDRFSCVGLTVVVNEINNFLFLIVNNCLLFTSSIRINMKSVNKGINLWGRFVHHALTPKSSRPLLAPFLYRKN